LSENDLLKIFIPSSGTPLYVLKAFKASSFLSKITSAVPCDLPELS